MTEFELKLIVPAAACAAVERAVATASARRTRLRAAYFDTPDRALAAAGMALRLRLEGPQWVQTLKAGSAGSLERFEHNVSLVARGTQMPTLDVQRHAGTACGDALAALLAAPGAAALVESYRTDIERIHRVLRLPGGSVELAFDRGQLVAGERRQPVCELEIELKSGERTLVTEVAKRFVRRHGLWLDVRSKAERGDRLARGLEVGEVKRAPAPALSKAMSADAAARACIGTLVQGVLLHSSEVGSGVHGPEHLHQLRVALRRLRTALRFIEGWAPSDAAVWQAALAEPFRVLGEARDQDVLAATLLPQLLAAGMPALQQAGVQRHGSDPAAALQAPRFNLLLLDLLGFALGAPLDATGAEPPARPAELAARALGRLHAQVRRDARHFAELDDASRHRLRRRVKRLRYTVEFARGLFGRKRVERYLKRLLPLQDSLGLLNDVIVALEWARTRVEHDAQAWFAVGWLTAQRGHQAAQCIATLPGFLEARRFWR